VALSNERFDVVDAVFSVALVIEPACLEANVLDAVVVKDVDLVAARAQPVHESG